MGYLEKNYGMHLLNGVPEGTCPECAVKHTPDQPHNRDSLFYQYHFCQLPTPKGEGLQ